MHFYPENYVPADLSNFGWNSLGFCSIYYTENKINNQPTQWGQFINIPSDKYSESVQLWIEQDDGTIYSRTGNGEHPIDAAKFRRFARLDEVERVYSMGGNWIQYTSGFLICWVNSVGGMTRWNFPTPFAFPPVVVGSATTQHLSWISNISNTGCNFMCDAPGNCIAIGRWY